MNNKYKYAEAKSYYVEHLLTHNVVTKNIYYIRAT